MNVLLTNATTALGGYILNALVSAGILVYVQGTDPTIIKIYEDLNIPIVCKTKADILKLSFKEINFHTVIHIPSENPDSDEVKYTSLLAAKCLEECVSHFIHLSDANILYLNKEQLSINESDIEIKPNIILQPELQAKAKMEQNLEQYAHLGLNISILRPTHMLGEFDKVFLPMLLNLNKVGIPDYCKSVMVDLVTFTNVAKVVKLLLLTKPVGFMKYHISNDTPISWNDFLNKFIPNITQHPVNYIKGVKSRDIKDVQDSLIEETNSSKLLSIHKCCEIPYDLLLCLSNSHTVSTFKATKELLYTPIYSIDEALSNFVVSYKKYPNYYAVPDTKLKKSKKVK